jgi:hypothetical protein
LDTLFLRQFWAFIWNRSARTKMNRRYWLAKDFASQNLRRRGDSAQADFKSRRDFARAADSLRYSSTNLIRRSSARQICSTSGPIPALAFYLAGAFCE